MSKIKVDVADSSLVFQRYEELSNNQTRKTSALVVVMVERFRFRFTSWQAKRCTESDKINHVTSLLHLAQTCLPVWKSYLLATLLLLVYTYYKRITLNPLNLEVLPASKPFPRY